MYKLAADGKDAIDKAVIAVTGRYTPQTIILMKKENSVDYTLIDDVIEALNN
jgi:hypothetical protein